MLQAFKLHYFHEVLKKIIKTCAQTSRLHNTEQVKLKLETMEKHTNLDKVTTFKTIILFQDYAKESRYGWDLLYTDQFT